MKPIPELDLPIQRTGTRYKYASLSHAIIILAMREFALVQNSVSVSGTEMNIARRRAASWRDASASAAVAAAATSYKCSRLRDVIVACLTRVRKVILV